MHPTVRTLRKGLTINHDNLMLLTNDRGEIHSGKQHGLFANDTRFISKYRLLINGRSWKLENSATPAYNFARCFLTNRTLHSTGRWSRIEAGVLELVLLRHLECGLQESFELTNYGSHPQRLQFEIELQSDFADILEVRRDEPQSRHGIVTTWDGDAAEWSSTYRQRDYVARCTYQVVQADSSPVYADDCLAFPITLAPKHTWRAQTRAILSQNGRTWNPTARSPVVQVRERAHDRAHSAWAADCTRLVTPNQNLQCAFSRAVDDLAALRLYDDQLGPDVWIAAAGIPWYLTLFGRDAVVTGSQSLMTHPGFALGALRILPRYQAHAPDDWLEAQPGKMPHELRHGELTYFDRIPKKPDYNSWDTTALYLMLLHRVWRWLGERRLVMDLLPVIDRCLDWIDHEGDLDGDGFQEYRSFSRAFTENMSWKDASNAVVYPDGSRVHQPKATCELQAYVYGAKLGVAEMLRALGDRQRADRLEREANQLKTRFNASFWIEDEGTFAFGLDAEKRQIRTVVSNAGLCLWAGIADADKAARVAERLLAEDMFSGWGIRTLSARNPAYNPLDYQLGSVWPVDNAMCAAGMKRYGFSGQANRVIGALLEAAARSDLHRLPEVFLGHQREGESFPVHYIGANSPQAWSSSSIFSFVETLLGLAPDAAEGKLYVAPTLPDDIPEIQVNGLRVGTTRLSIRFWREGTATRFKVCSADGAGSIEVIEAGRYGWRGLRQPE